MSLLSRVLRPLETLGAAARSLRRRPGFALPAIVILSLGIGTNAAVFGIVHAILIESLPYDESDRLVLIDGHLADEPDKGMPMSHLDIRSVAEEAESITGIAARSLGRSLNLIGEHEARHITGELVDGAYFRTLRVTPALGSFFEPTDSTAPEQVAVISHALWQDHFGAASDIVGTSVEIDGRTYAVLGVAPAGFRGLSDQAEIWLPISMASEIYAPFYLEARAFRWLAAVGRLAPGVSIQEANSELAALTSALAEDFPDTNASYRAQAQSLSAVTFGSIRTNLLALWGASGIVLLVASVNVTVLLVIRLASRRSEMALRLALGARRARLAGELAAEALVVAAVATVAGIMVAATVHQVASAFLLRGLPSFVAPGINLAVLAMMMGVTLLSTAIAAAGPAWVVARRPGREWLTQRGASGGPRTGERLLVVAEVALAAGLSVLAVAALIGFAELLSSDLGFRREGTITARMDVQDARFDDNGAYLALVDELRAGLEQIPGVQAAALIGPKMPTDDWNSVTVSVEDRANAGLDPMGIDMVVHRTTPGFLQVSGITLLAGREFSAGDRGGIGAEPVVMVSETTAARMWPDEQAVGKLVKLGGPASNAPWMTVVGIVADAEFAGLGPAPPLDMHLYLPLLQWPARTPPVLNLMLRTDAPNETILPALRRLAREVAPASPLFDVRTIAERIDDQTASQRTVVTLMGIFALLTLLLSAIGAYAVAAHDVARRHHEFGVRLALGSRREGVVGLVLRAGLRVGFMGTLVGLGAAFAVLRLVDLALLGDVGLANYGAVAAAVLTVTVGATLPSGLRASRHAPAAILRRS